MTSCRSLRTHARRGALKEAFGRCTISCGQPVLRGPFEGDLALPTRDLVTAPNGERRAGHDGVDERDAHFDGSRHARPVGVRQVESRQEQARIGQAHPVDFIVQRIVVVDSAVIIDDLVHIAGQVRADQGGELVGVVQRVTTAEPRSSGSSAKVRKRFAHRA